MKTAQELEQEFISKSKELTGKDVEEWMKALKPTGLSKMKETTEYLKKELGIKHMQASFIAGIYANGGKPVYDDQVLFNAHFEGKEDKKPIYDAIAKMVMSTFPTTEIVPTKGYISFRNKKEFAVAKINKKEIRVGMDLGSKPFNDYTVKAKTLGTMPRIGHMVEIHDLTEVNETLRTELIEANQLVNE